MDVGYETVERIAAGAARKNRDKLLFGHFQVDRLPEVAVGSIDVDLGGSEAQRLTPKFEDVAFLEGLFHPVVEGRLAECLKMANDYSERRIRPSSKIAAISRVALEFRAIFPFIHKENPNSACNPMMREFHSFDEPKGSIAPGDAANERLVARKLGVNGFKRWQYFRQHFSDRWGDEGQAPVSPRSQEALLKALSMLDFPVSAKPSLFLTDDGFFELAWHDAQGRSVQIEFGSSHFEIFVEGANVEETHPNCKIPEVIAKLSAA